MSQLLAEFEIERGTSGDLILEAGDREHFIRDGGQKLDADVAQLMRDRGYRD